MNNETHYLIHLISMLVQEQSIEFLLLMRLYGLNQSLVQSVMKA